ncbi:MAG: DUF927 domain-containing protein [Magnetococcales bacterium]|nr:DUF927 domain-containing protein [Magnetococcales bacterium]
MHQQKSPGGDPGKNVEIQGYSATAARQGQGRLDVATVRAAATGRWREILTSLEADPKVLNGKASQPCPACSDRGDQDRFHFTNRSGSGSYVCRKCGGGNDSFSLVGKLLKLDPNRDFPKILEAVAVAIGLDAPGMTDAIQRDASPAPATDAEAHPWAGQPLPPVEIYEAESECSVLPPDPEPTTAPLSPTLGERWARAVPADDNHPYLQRKGIKAHGLRQEGANLLMPLHDAAGNVQTLQTIAPDGSKRLAAGCPKKGACFTLGGETEIVCVCEGFATAASVHEATGHQTVVAIDAGNMMPVTRIIRERYPDRTIILCADDDAHLEHNPGRTKAEAAALAVDAFVALPDFGSDRPEGVSDFNDLMQLRGADAVRKCVAAARKPEATQEKAAPVADAAQEVHAERPAAEGSRDEERRKFPFRVVEGQKGRRNGTYFLPPADGDEVPEPVWICSPLHITARTRDSGQNNHGRLLEFDDPDGHLHSWAMPMSLCWLGTGRNCVPVC